MTHTDNALIVVDYQNSFIPKVEGGTGELGVEEGGTLATRINELMKETKSKGGLIIATRDVHPEGHMSFASNYKGKNPFEMVDWDEVVNALPKKLELEDTAKFTLADLQVEFGAKGSQMLWPDHCVENTPGAQYHKDLDTSLINHHIIKGYDPTTEMYSGFFGREDTVEGKTLTEILQEAGVKTVRLVGLATDYCVQSTAVDSVKNGFISIIHKALIAGVAVKPEDTVAYLEALREKEGVDFE